MKWTASRVDELKSRLKRGFSVDELARSFRITPNAVSKKVHGLGLSLKGGQPLKRKARTRRERMGERPRTVTMSEKVPSISDILPRPTAAETAAASESSTDDATKPVTAEELKRKDGGLKMWGPNP